jgi:hypothetical protein
MGSTLTRGGTSALCRALSRRYLMATPTSLPVRRALNSNERGPPVSIAVQLTYLLDAMKRYGA